jgi:DNA-binding transcriptional ArsR family regulator
MSNAGRPGPGKAARRPAQAVEETGGPFAAARSGQRWDLGEMADIDLEELKTKVARATALLKALGNEVRVMILCELAQGERSVGEIQAVVGVGQSALSQHLARLRRDGLVATRREAQTIFYSIASHEALSVMATLYDLYCGDTAQTRAIPKEEAIGV